MRSSEAETKWPPSESLVPWPDSLAVVYVDPTGLGLESGTGCEWVELGGAEDEVLERSIGSFSAKNDGYTKLDITAV